MIGVYNACHSFLFFACRLIMKYMSVCFSIALLKGLLYDQYVFLQECILSSSGCLAEIKAFAKAL